MQKKFELELETGNGAYFLFGKGYMLVFDPDKDEKVASDGMGASISKIEKGEEKMDETKLSAPYHRMLHEYEALFEGDKEVTIACCENDMRIDLLVSNPLKADALTRLLPSVYKIGRVDIKVRVVSSSPYTIDLFRRAFAGNSAVSRIKMDARGFDYVVFNRDVVQFYNDDVSDINGNETTLYEDIARDIFKEKAGGIFFCTEGEPK